MPYSHKVKGTTVKLNLVHVFTININIDFCSLFFPYLIPSFYYDFKSEMNSIVIVVSIISQDRKYKNNTILEGTVKNPTNNLRRIF